MQPRSVFEPPVCAVIRLPQFVRVFMPPLTCGCAPRSEARRHTVAFATPGPGVEGSLFEPPGSPCGALVLKLVWDLPNLPALLEARVQRTHRWAAAPGAQLLPICHRR